MRGGYLREGDHTRGGGTIRGRGLSVGFYGIVVTGLERLSKHWFLSFFKCDSFPFTGALGYLRADNLVQ